MNRVGPTTGMWDEEDGFFYDVLRLPDNTGTRLKVRSMVGLLPLCAITVFEKDGIEHLPHFVQRTDGSASSGCELFERIHSPGHPRRNGRRMLAAARPRCAAPDAGADARRNEFLSDYGIRSLSRYHEDNPYRLRRARRGVPRALPSGESDTGMFGGNSNWRGPIWMPVNALIFRALLQMYSTTATTSKWNARPAPAR